MYVPPNNLKELDAWPEPERSLYYNAAWVEINYIKGTAVKEVPASEPREMGTFPLSSHLVLTRKSQDAGVEPPEMIFDRAGKLRPVTVEEQAVLRKYRFKGRCTIHGNRQPAWQIGDTFSPTASIVLLRFMIALLCCHDIPVKSSNDWDCYSFDVSNAFCWADLDPNDPPVYMQAPISGVCEKGTVFRLIKALYGLKSSPRRWSELLTKLLVEIGWVPSEYDPSLFLFWKESKLHGALAPFVDDAQSVCEPWLWIFTVEELRKHIVVKDFGAKPKTHVGIEYTWTPEGVYMSQHKYIEEMLTKFGYNDPRLSPKKTPGNHKSRLEPAVTDTDPSDVRRYQQEVGSLMHLVGMTRPDCAFALNQLTRHLIKQDKAHRDAVERVFRYLKGTKYYASFCKYGSSFRSFFYTDSDWATDVTDRKSITGFFAEIDGFMLHYYARGQKSVSINTMESELFAFSQGIRCVAWFRCIMLELKLIGVDQATVVYCDNESALDTIASNAGRTLSKHIDIRLKHAQAKIATKEIRASYISSENNKADFFTKYLDEVEHHRQLNRMLTLLPKDFWK